jgi:hypothetical protein
MGLMLNIGKDLWEIHLRETCKIGRERSFLRRVVNGSILTIKRGKDIWLRRKFPPA